MVVVITEGAAGGSSFAMRMVKFQMVLMREEMIVGDCSGGSMVIVANDYGRDGGGRPGADNGAVGDGNSSYGADRGGWL